MSKKTRGPNFSSNEKEIIISLVTKYKDVVENKKTDAVTTAAKNEGWKRLTDEFNSISQYNNRSIEQLKTSWDNIKRNTRKDKAKLKKEILLTGGGRPDIPPSEPFQGQIEAILGPTLSGLTNQYDSDALFMDQNKESSLIENKIESIGNNILIQPSTSMSNFIVEDNLTLVSEEESVADPSIIMASNKCVNIQQEESQNIEPAGGPSVTTTKEDEHLIVVPEDKDMNAWKRWSPAALKTKSSEKLTPKNESSPWLRRRRPKTSLQDKILENQLELLELMKKNVQSEANMKNLILQEQLKQEKIKTLNLELRFKLEKQTSSQHSEN